MIGNKKEKRVSVESTDYNLLRTKENIVDNLIHSTTKNSNSVDVQHRRHYHIRGKSPFCLYFQDTLWPTYNEAKHDFAAKLWAQWIRLTFDYCDQDCLD